MTLLGLRTPKPPQQGQAPASLSPWSRRTDVVSVMDTYQYEDPQDIFSREPFILRVSAPRTSKCWEGGDGPQPLLGGWEAQGGARGAVAM